MQKKPKILFLTTQLPYPPISGGVIKSWRLIEHWAVNTDLTVLTLLKNDDSFHESTFLHRLNKKISYKGFSIQKARTPFNLLKSYLFADTLNVYRNKLDQFRNEVDKYSKDADILFLDHYEMGQYIPLNFKGKIILHEHNAEFIMWKRLAEIEPNPLKKLILILESKRIARAELKYISKSDKTLAAPNDIEELVQVGADRSKLEITYHLGEDEMLKWPNIEFSKAEESILFVGTLTWEANVDGLIWWFEKVWPIIKSANTKVRTTIVGKNPDQRLIDATRGDDRVHFTGFIEDLRPYYDKSRVFIVPLRFGSGIKVKLLNALYRGVPTVTTGVGVEGLDVKSGTEIYFTSDPEKYADHVLTLLSNSSKWSEMRDASRIKGKEYSWEHLLKAHDALIQSMLNYPTSL